MENVYIYIVESVIISGVYLLFYAVALRTSNNFTQNRIYLLSSTILSVLIPLINFKLPINQPNSATLQVLNQITVNGIENSVEVFFQNMKTENILKYIYIFGTIFFSLKLIFSFISLIKLYKNGKKIIMPKYVLVYSRKKISPFSFFKFIFINKTNITKKEQKEIIKHEKIHVFQKHSLDILFVEILTLIFWINPILFILKKYLKENHEFFVDKKIINSNKDITRYISIMLKQSEGLRPVLANRYNNSLTLKRLIMMKKNNFAATSKFRYLLAIPLLLLTLAVFSCKDKKEIKEEKIVKIVEGENIKNDSLISEDEIKGPKFPGGVEAMQKFFIANIKYPENAREAGLQDIVYVQFNVSKEGNVSDVKIKKGKYESLNAEALRIVKLMPKWEASELEGDEQKFEFVIPIRFKLDDKK